VALTRGELTTQVAKLALSTASQLRLHQAVLIYTLIVEDTAEYAKAMFAAGLAYAEDHRQKLTNGHTYRMAGPPHPYVWAALVCGLLTLFAGAKADTLAQQLRTDLELLKAHSDSTSSPLALQDNVHICRISKAFMKGTAKIQLSVSAELQPVLAALTRLLQSKGATLMHGAPPKSPLERAVETSLRRSGALV
jgi:hypothetical protein